MSPPSRRAMSEVTHILDAVAAGDPQAAAQLLPLVYAELRRPAAAGSRPATPSSPPPSSTKPSCAARTSRVTLARCSGVLEREAPAVRGLRERLRGLAQAQGGERHLLLVGLPQPE